MSESVVNTLMQWFQDESVQAEHNGDFVAWAGANGIGNEVTATELSQDMNTAIENVSTNQARGDTAVSFGNTGGPAGGASFAPLPAPAPGQSAQEYVASVQPQVQHITQEVNNTYVDESDNRVFDQSNEANIVAGPGANVSLDQSGDNLNLDGDGATAVTGDANQVQTGDGVQAAGDIDGDILVGDGNVTGDGNTVGDGNISAGGDAIVGNEGLVNTGAIADSTIGDGNIGIDAGGDVGPLAFGDGDAIDASTNVSAGGDVGAVGNDNIQASDIDGNINIGGNQAVDEVNTGDIGGNANFGDGQIGDNTSFDINAGGDAQVAGGDQQAAIDNSTTETNVDASTNDSFNTDIDASVNDSFNEDFAATDSFNTDVDASTNDSFNEDFNSADSFNTDIQNTEVDNSVGDVNVTDFG